MKEVTHVSILKGWIILLVGLFIISFVSASSYLTGEKSVSPSVLYVGENATISLTVSGEGSATSVSVPLDVMLVIDNSCSMGGTKLSNAKVAANLFIDELNSQTDRVGVVSFNIYPSLKTGLTFDFSSARNKLKSLSSCGKTNIGQAIKLASSQFSDENSRVIVSFSDGRTNLPANAKVYALEQAELAAGKNITIYTIGFGSDVDSNILRDIATAGDGFYLHYPFGSAIENIFEDISQIENTVAGTNVIVTDVLEAGVFPVSLPSECSYSVSSNTVSCNAGALKINETKTFSFQVSVYNSSLKHLNKIAYVNYTNYYEDDESFILNNPLVDVLSDNICLGNVAPAIQIISPQSLVYNRSVLISINVSDSNLEEVYYNLGNGNVSYSSPINVSLNNGNYRLYVYASDSCGARGSAYVDFVVYNHSSNDGDNIGPNVTIVSPENAIYNSSLIRLNITAVDDVAVDSVWYSLNGVSYNYSDSFLMNLSEGNYTLLAYANDSSGNLGFDSVSFVVNFSHNNTDNQSDESDDSEEDCGGHTHAPVDDFADENVEDSIFMDEKPLVLNYIDNSTRQDDFNWESFVSGKNNNLLFNMILLIAILVLLFLIVLVVKRAS